MKRFLTGIIAASAIAGVFASTVPAQAAPQPLTVGTYNVLKVDGQGVPAWADRFTRFPAIIQTINADVLGLEEVTNNLDPATGQMQSDEVRAALAGLGYQMLTPADNQCVRPRDAGGQLAGPNPCDNTATLAWRTSAVDVAPSVNGLPMTGMYLAGSLAPADADANARQVPWAFLTQKSTGKTFLAIGAHTVSGQTAVAESGRVAFANALTAWSNNLAAARGYTNLPTFLAGDLNSYKARQPAGAQTILANAGWADPYYTAPSKAGVRWATINTTPQTAKYNGYPPKPYTYAKKNEPSRIDYVLYRNATPISYETVVRLNADGTFVDGLRMSDHNAVVASFGI